MTSTLLIKLNISGGLDDKNVSYKPQMTDRTLDAKAETIYFPPTIKITEPVVKEIAQGMPPITVFTLRDKFSRFLRYYTRRRSFKKISVEDAYKKGIIRDNLHYFKELLFPDRGSNKIYLGERVYTILSSDVDHFKIPPVGPSSMPPFTFEMTINIKVIRQDKNTLENRTKMNCVDKRKAINKTMDDLGWFDSGFDEREEDRGKLLGDDKTGPMYSSVATGVATGKVPGKEKQAYARYYNPYAPPMRRASSSPTSSSTSSSGSGLTRPIMPYNPFAPGFGALPYAYPVEPSAPSKKK
jgi:hypothetical protein